MHPLFKSDIVSVSSVGEDHSMFSVASAVNVFRPTRGKFAAMQRLVPFITAVAFAAAGVTSLCNDSESQVGGSVGHVLWESDVEGERDILEVENDNVLFENAPTQKLNKRVSYRRRIKTSTERQKENTPLESTQVKQRMQARYSAFVKMLELARESETDRGVKEVQSMQDLNLIKNYESIINLINAGELFLKDGDRSAFAIVEYDEGKELDIENASFAKLTSEDDEYL